jgi:hypothetical protein
VGAERVVSFHGGVHAVSARGDRVGGVRREERFDVVRVERVDLALHDLLGLHRGRLPFGSPGAARGR